jgi:hypothetical protein
MYSIIGVDQVIRPILWNAGLPDRIGSFPGLLGRIDPVHNYTGF